MTSVVCHGCGCRADRLCVDGELQHLNAYAVAAFHGCDHGNSGSCIDVAHVGYAVIGSLGQPRCPDLHGGSFGRSVVNVGRFGKGERCANRAQIGGLKLCHCRILIQSNRYNSNRSGSSCEHAVIRDGYAVFNRGRTPENSCRRCGILVDHDVVIARLERHAQLLRSGGTFELCDLLTVQEDHCLEVGIAHEDIGERASKRHALIAQRILRVDLDILICHCVIDGNQNAEVARLGGAPRYGGAVLGKCNDLGIRLGDTRHLNVIALKESAALRGGYHNTGCLGVNRELIQRSKAVVGLIHTREAKRIYAVLQIGQRNVAAVPFYGFTVSKCVRAGTDRSHSVHLHGDVFACHSINCKCRSADLGLDRTFNAQHGLGLNGGNHLKSIGEHYGGQKARAVIHVLVGLHRNLVGFALLKSAVGYLSRCGIGSGVASAQEDRAIRSCCLFFFGQFGVYVAENGGDQLSVFTNLVNVGNISVVIGIFR